MRIFRSLAALAMLAIASCTAGAAVAAVTYDEPTHTLTVDGETTMWQFLMIKGFLEANEVDTIYMSGPGGSFYAGLGIGNLIAAEGAQVIIPRGTYCTSACAFAAMAADRLDVHGELLLHRPHIPFIGTSMTLDEYAGLTGVAYLDGQLYLLNHGYDPTLMRFLVETTGPQCFQGISGMDVAFTMRLGPIDGLYTSWQDMFYFEGSC